MGSGSSVYVIPAIAIDVFMMLIHEFVLPYGSQTGDNSVR